MWPTGGPKYLGAPHKCLVWLVVNTNIALRGRWWTAGLGMVHGSWIQVHWSCNAPPPTPSSQLSTGGASQVRFVNPAWFSRGQHENWGDVHCLFLARRCYCWPGHKHSWEHLDSKKETKDPRCQLIIKSQSPNDTQCLSFASLLFCMKREHQTSFPVKPLK